MKTETFNMYDYARYQNFPIADKISWLEKKVRLCKKLLAEGRMDVKTRLQIVEDKLHYTELLEEYQGKEAKNG